MLKTRIGYRPCRTCGGEVNCADMISGLCPACAGVHAAELSRLQRQYEAAVAAGEEGAASKVAGLIHDYEISEQLHLKASRVALAAL